MTEALKPCPFCGGKPYLANVAMAGCAYVVCTDCRMQSDDGSQERVTAAWNTRATPAAMEVPDGLIDALRSGEQADMDGTMVKVSRQACEQAADLLAALRAGGRA